MTAPRNVGDVASAPIVRLRNVRDERFRICRRSLPSTSFPTIDTSNARLAISTDSSRSERALATRSSVSVTGVATKAFAAFADCKNVSPAHGSVSGSGILARRAFPPSRPNVAAFYGSIG